LRAASHSSSDTIFGFSIVFVDISISPSIHVQEDFSCSIFVGVNLDGVDAGLLSMAIFPPNFLITIAASPPEEETLPAISIAVDRHTGHMSFSSLAAF
jgi:hypothetical protein